MRYIFALLAAIMIVLVGKTIMRQVKNKSKVGELLFRAPSPRKIMSKITIGLAVLWVFIIGTTIVQKQFNEYLLLYIFWLIWTADLAFKNNHGLRVCENGIFLYHDFITWDEFKSATWEKARRGENYFVKLDYTRNLGVEKKRVKYIEVGAEDKKSVEKLLRKHGKSSNR